MFKLGNSEFEIEKAELIAAFETWDDEEDTSLTWGINIEMAEGPPRTAKAF